MGTNRDEDHSQPTNLRHLLPRFHTMILEDLMVATAVSSVVAALGRISFETTLTPTSYRTSILEWRRLGYRVVLYFIWFLSAEIAIDRVASRVQQGGHDTPETFDIPAD